MNAPDAGADVRDATDSAAGDDVRPRLLQRADELVAGAVDRVEMFSACPADDARRRAAAAVRAR